MANLRAQNYLKLEAIYTEIKTLIQQYKRLKEMALVFGLQKINRSIGLIINYEAGDEKYWLIVGGAATALNCLFNVNEWRLSKEIKEALSSLFNRLAATLPDDFQLTLFEASREFGWSWSPEDESTSPKTNHPWFSFIKKIATVVVPQWLVNVLRGDWVSPFRGKQLAFADVVRERIS
jgi:hypothetical protein